LVGRVSDKAALGDAIEIALPDEQRRQPIVPEEGQLERLFEDEFLLVVSKPAGIVSHPTYRHPGGSLLNVVLWHARDWPRGARPSLVGRLDKLTSGAVLVAKTTEAHARLQRALSSVFSEKSYLAIVHGRVSPVNGTIDLPLQRDPADRRRVVIARGEGLRSVTRYERLDQVVEAGVALATVRCRLETGRMHQLRVHLSARGWPIVGDAKYGGDGRERTRGDHPAAAFPRQALHAWRLRFRHPFSSEEIDVTAPIPVDIARLIEGCGLKPPTP
jgi:23S rRNA pseudouridine1911/1915/1917 synthase